MRTLDAVNVKSRCYERRTETFKARIPAPRAEEGGDFPALDAGADNEAIL